MQQHVATIPVGYIWHVNSFNRGGIGSSLLGILFRGTAMMPSRRAGISITQEFSVILAHNATLPNIGETCIHTLDL